MLRTAIVVSVALITFPISAHAIRCTDGSESHPASALEAENGGVPIGYPVCPVDAQAGVTANAGAAKKYLQSLGNGSNTTRPESFQNLNSPFAICAAQFLKEFQAKYGSVKITSAWRSQQDQQNVCPVAVAGKCGGSNSNHTKGLAIDVRPTNENFEQMWSFAKQNPQFGVCFPFEGGDRVHMILQGIPGSQEAQHCVQRGYGNTPCSGSGFDPSTIQEASSGNQGQAQTPSSGITDALRQYLNGGNQQQPQQSPGGSVPKTTAVPAGNAIPSSSQPYQATQPGYTAVPASTGGSSGGSSAGGTTASVPSTIAVPSYTNPLSTPTPVSDQINAPQNTEAKNIADLLNALARPTTATTTIATGTPIALNPNIVQSIGTTYTNPQTAHTLQPSTATPYALVPPVQTFTSPDLQYSQSGTSYTPPTNTTIAQRTLENLKQVLLTLLKIIQPFGVTRSSSEHLHEEEYME